MIVATAGHVDHGKTSLVRALTGVECDRLPEEQRRGMSIDLGFAYVNTAVDTATNTAIDTATETGRLGFVDVPGHERFVANLLAGIAGIDLAVLVVAADDGPMPQTREHLTILRLLGIARCIVALTKVDRVDPARQAAARAEVEALLAAGPFAGAPVFPVVATTGSGVAALRRAIEAVAAGLPPRPTDGAFRLAVDRSFLLAGAGRVVTGAVLSGRVRVGDRVVVSPDGAEMRVRGLHAQGRPADAAVAGERCALNLAGAALKDAAPARGDWIVAPAVHAPTDRLDVRLETAAPSIPAGGLQLHLGGAVIAARVARLGGPFAQLVLGRPVAALHGDRFVLRDPAAGAVVAGGSVLDPFATARGRASPGRVARLASMAANDPGEALAGLLAGDEHGIDFDRFVLVRNLDPVDAEALARHPGVTVVTLEAGRRAVATTHWAALRQRTVAALAAAHAAQPGSVGSSLASLAAQLGMGRAAALLRAALAGLAEEGRVAREGFRWRLADHRAVLAPEDAALLARVTAVLAPAGLRPPIVGELATALGLRPADLLDFLARASGFGALVRVAPNRWFLPTTVADLAGHAARLAAKSDAGFDAAAFRDRTGIGRNLTVQVLEFLDRERITRFDGRRRFVAG